MSDNVVQAPPKQSVIDLRTLVLQADPNHYSRPQLEYEFSNGRKFYDKETDIPIGG